MSIIDLNNTVQLRGHAGGAAELRKTSNDRDVANFRLATNSSNARKDKETGEWVEQEEQWHNVVAWGPTAQYVHNNLKKGSQVSLLGRLVTREYMRKVKLDGGDTVEVRTWSTEIHVGQISIRNPDRSAGAPSQTTKRKSKAEAA